MDNALRFAKKYYFWPVCIIAMGLALFFWNSSIGALDKEFASNESNYTQSRSSVDNIPSNPPNDKMIKAVERKKKNLMKNVFNAWESLYKKQNENNKWPEIYIKERLVDFNAKSIIEGGPEQYRYRIVEEFRKMVNSLNLVSERDKNDIAIDDEIGRVNAPGSSATDAANSGDQAETEKTAAPKKELVVWSKTNIDDLIDEHFSWNGSPTKRQIGVAQEDFWIFKNILDSINTLNEGVDNRTNASLKEIRDIAITKIAAEKFRTRMETGFFDEKTFSKTNVASEDDAMEGSERSSESSSGGEGGDLLNKEFRELYDMRYVDRNGRGLSAEQYNASINIASAGINASKTRNVPVYMSLVIKQNRLSDLMSVLTNAEKPVDIKLVLINPGQGWTPSFDFSKFDDENGENAEDAQSEGSRGRAGTGKTSRRGGGRVSDSSISKDNLKIESDEIVVDIYGIISLFNAPSKDIFPDAENNLADSDNNSEDENADDNPEDENASDSEEDANSEQ